MDEREERGKILQAREDVRTGEQYNKRVQCKCLGQDLHTVTYSVRDTSLASGGLLAPWGPLGGGYSAFLHCQLGPSPPAVRRDPQQCRSDDGWHVATSTLRRNMRNNA
ncbi:hypothetical protein E2C01_031222 [Portunus trituberculatus]|uniref:Uncharacterized protein n=1 Tax=Portunus trituberculatus TaxID=210409 RepID=A0A5B7ETX8_PORTR|nr:hypothetical protein [Portunus trituberculatus]